MQEKVPKENKQQRVIAGVLQSFSEAPYFEQDVDPAAILQEKDFYDYQNNNSITL